VKNLFLPSKEPFGVLEERFFSKENGFGKTKKGLTLLFTFLNFAMPEPLKKVPRPT
jgi:hypothetical protein